MFLIDCLSCSGVSRRVTFNTKGLTGVLSKGDCIFVIVTVNFVVYKYINDARDNLIILYSLKVLSKEQAIFQYPFSKTRPWNCELA